MKRRANDFALGLTTLAALALFVGTILLLRPLFADGGRIVTIRFPDDRGMAPLERGSAVPVGGAVPVGQVRDSAIREVEAPPGAPRLREVVFDATVALRDDVKLYEGCVIAAGQPAVGGAGYVDVVSVGRVGAELPAGPPVRGGPPQSLATAIGELSARVLGEGGLLEDLEQALDPAREESLLRKVALILDNVHAVTVTLWTQTGSEDRAVLLGKLHQLPGDLGAITGALRGELTGGDATVRWKVHAALDRLNVVLGETAGLRGENRPLVHETLTSVSHAARTVDRELLAALHAELDRTNPAALLGRVHAAMDRLNAALVDLQVLTDNVGRIVAVNRPALERAVGNRGEMTDYLRRASHAVLLNPSRLIWGPGARRKQQLLVFQAARSFAEAARDLDLAAARMQSLLADLPPAGAPGAAAAEELAAIQAAVRAVFERFERAEGALWEQLK